MTQTTRAFAVALRKTTNTTVHLLPSGCTDEVQPIDAGIGRLVKKYMNDALEEWLSDPVHFQQWITGIPATERRVLITHWLGKAWHKLICEIDIEKIVRKTGCLMTYDGSEDGQILPEGLKSHQRGRATGVTHPPGGENKNDDACPLYSFTDADADIQLPHDRIFPART